MKWGRRIAVTTLLSAGVLAVVLLLLPSQEPVYRGHTLSWWIHQLEANFARNPDRHDEAERAIQQIGTNALPTLLDWLRYDEPPWRRWLVYRLKGRDWGYRLIPDSPMQKLAMGPAGRHARFDARVGFNALGPAGRPAALELVALWSSKSRFVSRNAVDAFLNIQGQKGLILAAFLTNTESTVRLRAAEAIGLLFRSNVSPGEDPAPAVPFLVNALDDLDINVRRAVTNTLSLIAPKELEKVNTPGPFVPNTAPENVTNSLH